MKKLFKFFIPIIIILTLMLVGCDGDGRNPITHEKYPEETASVEELTENIANENPTDENQTEQDVDATQEMYENMVNDALTMDLNSKNVVTTISTDSYILEAENSASGDSKNVIRINDGIEYISYNFGEDSYLEIHVPAGETKEAEDLYYKITNNKISGNILLFKDVNVENLIESLQLSSENISSVKYLGKQNVHNMDCRAIEIIHRIKTDDEIINNQSFFYFTDLNTMFGFKFSTSTSTVDCYFPDNLKIALPKDVEFAEVEDSVINEKILAISSFNY